MFHSRYLIVAVILRWQASVSGPQSMHVERKRSRHGQ